MMESIHRRSLNINCDRMWSLICYSFQT